MPVSFLSTTCIYSFCFTLFRKWNKKEIVSKSEHMCTQLIEFTRLYEWSPQRACIDPSTRIDLSANRCWIDTWRNYLILLSIKFGPCSLEILDGKIRGKMRNWQKKSTILLRLERSQLVYDCTEEWRFHFF